MENNVWSTIEGRKVPTLVVESGNSVFTIVPMFDVFKEEDGTIEFIIEKVGVV